MLLVLIPLVIAIAENECTDIITQNDIPCSIISSWEYNNCTSTQVKIYNSTPALISTRNFSVYSDSGRCNITWNITQRGSYFWNVTNGDTGRLIVESEDDQMASLAITLFVLLITAAIFFVAFKVKFTENELANFIIRRCLIILGIFLMSLNTVIVVTIADTFGLGVTQELFRYLWILNWVGYLAMFVLGVQTILRSLDMWKVLAQKKRMGEE